MTTTSNANVLNHVFSVVLKLSSSRTQSLLDWMDYHGYKSIIDLYNVYVVYPQQILADLEYIPPETQETCKLSLVVGKLLQNLFTWAESMSSHKKRGLYNEDWMNLNKETFDKWKILNSTS